MLSLKSPIVVMTLTTDDVVPYSGQHCDGGVVYPHELAGAPVCCPCSHLGRYSLLVPHHEVAIRCSRQSLGATRYKYRHGKVSNLLLEVFGLERGGVVLEPVSGGVLRGETTRTMSDD